MSRRFWRRWTQLSSGQRGALLQAAPVMIAVRLWLWIVPLRYWNQRLKRMMSAAPDAQPNAHHVEIAWAVERIGRVPHMTCLVQAIAGYVLLRRSGLFTRLCIGVRRDADQFRAHAWLIDSRGDVIIGGQNGLAAFAAFDLDRGTESSFLKTL